MGLSGLAQLPPSLRASLPPGEEPLAWEPVAAAHGQDRIGMTGRPRVVESVELNPVRALTGGPIELETGFLDRWLGGITSSGSPGSWADRLRRAIDDDLWSTDLTSSRLAVTTHRVLLVAEGAQTLGTDPATGRGTWDAATRVRLELPRSAVLSARNRPRPLMAGRLVLAFDDGSTSALMCGMLSPRPARRLLAALAADRDG
ncbi:hypothetical protein [Nocardioides litoris]|uniref:hypothetical protein n=1 Tax=Nocardioides litoris TaxID=1926648 RepID=UPI00112492D2|nr:hypothetical protein [Nocardioides litoris]